MTLLQKFMAVSVFGLNALLGRETAAGLRQGHAPGSIVAIGGNEDKTSDMTVLKALTTEAKGIGSRIVVVTTASTEPDKRQQEYSRAFTALGVEDFTFIYIDNRDQAFDPHVYKKLSGADIIFFSGGDQLRLTALLAGTPFLSAVRQLHKDGAVVGGTSAGGAVLSDLMVYGGQSGQAAKKGEVLLTGGFRFVDRVAFDTHFLNRERLPRLLNIVASNPEILGIGMDEDTGVIFHDGGDTFEVVGSGKVTVVDGIRIQSNFHTIERGEAAHYRNAVVYTLSAGDRFNIKAKTPIRATRHVVHGAVRVLNQPDRIP
ncbi:MAG: cyanophycinase [Micavibrio aeruginosavorus]|uniref:Cyanophycinase n=1 Tax=Micavibrio aeruginosavorus TaxID=349221 RepID=A0A7T5R2P6_9BACT|nr:MAG: cyanophycinase [Micavibrio aeruginosavorus]